MKGLKIKPPFNPTWKWLRPALMQKLIEAGKKQHSLSKSFS